MRISESQLEPTTPPGTTQRSLRAGAPRCNLLGPPDPPWDSHQTLETHRERT